MGQSCSLMCLRDSTGIPLEATQPPKVASKGYFGHYVISKTSFLFAFFAEMIFKFLKLKQLITLKPTDLLQFGNSDFSVSI